MMSDVSDLYAEVRRDRGQINKGTHNPAVVDELALCLAEKTTDELSGTFDLKLSTYDWVRFTAMLQNVISAAILHTAFDPVPFPGRSRDPGDGT